MSLGRKIPTQVDVAREAGVSRALVSIAFRGVKGISPEMRDYILETARNIGYRPNMVAARLASKTSVTIGVFLLDLHNEIFADIYDGIRSVVDAADQHIVLAIGERGGSRDAEGLESLQLARADVIIGAGLMLPDAEIQKVNANVPVVSAARVIPGVDSVASDDEAGARSAVRHLYEMGHRRIAHIASPPRQGYEGRRTGYEREMREFGLESILAEADYSQVEAAESAAALFELDDPPTAVLATNDVVALGVLDAMHARGLTPGADVSVVGYDNTPIARLPGISLTSVDLHAVEIGAGAARVALARLKDPSMEPQQQVSRPALHLRDSTGVPKAPVGSVTSPACER